MSGTDSPLNVSFSSFAISMAQSALVHLGEVPDPVSKQTTIHLAAARHAIDVLGMLEAKTENNLDEEEDRLLASLLDELRTKFVAVSKAQSA